MNRWWWAIALAGLLGASAAQAQEASLSQAGEVPTRAEPSGSEPEATDYAAVAIAPAHGSRLSLTKVPRNVRLLTEEDLERLAPLGAHDALEERFGSVTINAVANNPLQPDLQYRGFTASPLLGTPQGLAAYQNGVRLNEPFGDVLQWDLVPVFAIRRLEVSPGANPLYGLNALGGSLVLRMKDGFHDEGVRVRALAGGFGRYQASAEVGHRLDDTWAVYVGASAFGERGFRYESPSSAWNFFGDLRNQTASRDVGVSVTGALTSLTGNGPAPVELLAQDRKAVFTYPDVTENSMLMVSGDLDQRLGDGLSLQGTAYFRHMQRNTLNGDEGEFEECDEDGEEVLCDEDGEVLAAETGDVIPALADYDGLYNTSATRSDGFGTWMQLTVERPLLKRENHFLVGAAFDGAQVAFLQRAELGVLNTDRSVTGQNVYLGGSEFRTKLGAYNSNLAVFASDTWTLLEPLALNVSARFNWAHVKLRDREGTALDGVHDFVRVNPAVGLTYAPLEALTTFVSYSEANRVPSAAELSCADPDEPCRVPNAFVADPPLDQVVSRTLELGLRGRHAGEDTRLSWSLAAYAARNEDDILFVAGSRVGTGYFRNAGRTQRLGIEADLAGSYGPLRWYASYQLIRATFESELELPGGAHPDAEGGGGDDDDDDEGGSIDVRPGDRMPGIPTHSFKAGLAVRPLPRWEIALSLVAQTGQYLRGDEVNLQPQLPGFAVLNARMSYQPVDPLTLFVKAQNVTNARYETFGILADPSEVIPDLSDPRFVSPGPPVAVWVGLQVAR